jgi:hypothetical protein
MVASRAGDGQAIRDDPSRSVTEPDAKRSLARTPVLSATTEPVPQILLPDADIYLVGGGMRLPNDLTLEGLAALRRCHRVFGDPAIDLTGYGVPEMVDLGILYRADLEWGETYRAMVDTVLRSAADRSPVAYFTYGSPVVGFPPAHLLLRQEPRHRFHVHVSHAASFLDAIWAELHADPFRGAQIWSAQRFLDNCVEPYLYAPLILAQATAVGIRRQPTERQARDLVALRDYLLRFYAAGHVVLFVWSDSFAGPAVQHWTRLDQLAQAPLDAPAPTLVIPPMRRTRR